MPKTPSIAASMEAAPLLDIDQLGKQFGASLIVAPHPDDEALGCAGMISYLVSQNISVFIVFMTSGGKSHPHSQTYSEDVLIATRENEALKACELIGISKDRVFFFRQPDGELHQLSTESLHSIYKRLAALIKKYGVASLFVPWRHDGHPDHVISNKIATNAIKRSEAEVQLVEYPIWLWKKEEAVWPLENETTAFRLNVAPVLDKKREAIYAHASQTSDLIDDDPTGFILTPELLAPFLSDYEYFFINKNDKMTALKKDYFDVLYRNNPDPWNFKHSDYERQKYETIDHFIGDSSYDNGLELGCSIGIQTSYLAARCRHLLAVDVNTDAIKEAEENNKFLKNVDFAVVDVIENFPHGTFDFISLCEMGYYFTEDDLMAIFKSIDAQLIPGGQLLFVHWTSFVREYPLHGTDVNKLFKKCNATIQHFKCLTTYKHEKYELAIWQKT